MLTSIVATALRGMTLWSRGILEHDEGHALLNANTWHQIMRWVLGGGLWDGNGGSIAQLRDTLHRQGGTLYSAGKFGYSLLLATVALPGEVTQGLGLLLAWACGIAVCLLAGLLTWQYTRSAIAAALTLFGCAMSPLLGTLSGEVSGTIWALMFGLAAACAMQAGADAASERRRWLWGIFGGFLLGYGFTCHFNLTPFIVAIFLATGIYGSRGRVGTGRIAAFLRAVAPAAIGSIFVLAVFEAVTRAVDYRLSDSFPEYRRFSEELHWLLFRDQAAKFDGEVYGDGAVGWGWNAWAIYGGAAWREGVVWIGLVVASVYFAIVRGGKNSPGVVRAGILLAVPLVFWAAYIFRVERVLGMCVAASWVFVGVALGNYLRQQIERRSKAFLWIQILMAAHLLTSGPAILVGQYSPIPKVVRGTLNHLKINGGQITAGSFDTGFAPLWKWTIVEQMRRNEFSEVKKAVDFSRFDGAEVLFIDPSTWRRPGGKDFTISRQQAARGKLIIQRNSESPRWHLESRDLRTP